MENTTRIKVLKVVLVLIGAFCIIGIYPLTIVWPSGWTWHSGGPSMYLQMILGVYATLGVFLILAARDPLQNRSLIWFAVWSSFVHGAIMAVQAFVYPEHRGHFLGDVPVLLIAGILVGLLMPRGEKAGRARSAVAT